MRDIILLLFFIFPKIVFGEEVVFAKALLQVGKHKIEVEVADSPAKHSRGLMFREKLKENKGMLFVYKSEKQLSFWMKNTFVPLSIGFFDKQKKLIEVLQMEASKSVMQQDVDRVQSSQKAMYALEMNLGWFKKNAIKPGQKFKYIKLNTDHSPAKTSP